LDEQLVVEPRQRNVQGLPDQSVTWVGVGVQPTGCSLGGNLKFVLRSSFEAAIEFFSG